MSNIFKVPDRVFRGLKRLVFGSEEMRRYQKVFLNYHVYDDQRSFDDQYADAYAFYEGLLKDGGFDPARSPVDIDNAVRHSYNKQYRIFEAVVAERDQMRAWARANYPLRPIPGSDDHMRQEAEKTFAATGVYGLPNSGGYILTKADKERLGLIY